METVQDVSAILDVEVLGKALLDAARTARIGIVVLTLEEPARHGYVSEAAADILGWPRADLLTRDFMTNVAPEDVPRMRQSFAGLLAGEPRTATHDLFVVRKDGTRTPIEATASSVTIGARQAILAFIVDGTARKEAEQERLRNESRFRELIECAPEPIGITRDHHFVYANRAFVTTLGYADTASLYATPLSSLLHPDELAVCRARSAVTLAGGPPQPPHIYRINRRDGSIALLEMTSVLFAYEGKPSVLIMARDISARKHLEAQLVQADRLAALGTLAAGAAHEINNPLAYVMLNLEGIARRLRELVQDPKTIADLTAMLDEAHHGARRVATIVRELRSFSRVEAESRRPVDLAKVVEAAIKITGHEIRYRARVSTKVEAVRPVWGNESRLEQVVINLLMNAAQAMPELRVHANEIRITIREDAERRAVLEIADNGEGIPADAQPRVFDPFFTTKPVGIGTGLGLSICHGIVASLGGQVTVFSEPGQGATFRVALPTTDAGDTAPTEAVHETSLAAPTVRARILVVDDEPSIVSTMRQLLGVSHDPVIATSAREALAILRAGAQFDVVFCDLMMPGMSGMDLYELLRVQFPAIARRCVFMTGGTFTTRAAAFLASIHNRHIEKPFSVAALERIVCEMLVEWPPAF